MGTLLAPQAFFSVLRWRADPTRDEARNVAVVLVNEDGTLGGVRAAPISSVSPKLHEQGLLDATLAALEHRFEQKVKPRLADLDEMRAQLQRSLYLTEPKPVAISDLDLTLDALYRAYAAPRSGGSQTLTKGRVLDRTMLLLRAQGWEVRRGQYVGDFIFDLVADKPEPIVGEVLSFASGAANLVPVEQDAGHFLYGLRRLGVRGLAVIQEPPSEANEKTFESLRRVRGWLDHEDVRVFKPEDLDLRIDQPRLLMYDAIDLSAERIASARRKVPDVIFGQSTVQDFVTDRKYDLVLTVECLMHVLPAEIEEVVTKLFALSSRYVVSLDWAVPLGDTPIAPWNFLHPYEELYGRRLRSVEQVGLQCLYLAEVGQDGLIADGRDPEPHRGKVDDRSPIAGEGQQDREVDRGDAPASRAEFDPDGDEHGRVDVEGEPALEVGNLRSQGPLLHGASKPELSLTPAKPKSKPKGSLKSAKSKPRASLIP